MKRRTLLVAAGAAPFAGRAAAQGCPALAGLAAVSGLGEISLVGNSFPAVAHIARHAEACARPGLKVAFKLTPNARLETEQAFASAGRSPFDGAVVSMGVFSSLYARALLAPMTDLVRQFGDRYRLEERMLVRVDGEVMAIAFMQNTQCLYFRADLFNKHRLKAPTTYAEMAQAAAVLQRDEPSITFPVAQGFAKGFDSATEFTNLLASAGGRFFLPGSATPAFHGPAGVQAVAAMRSLMTFMNRTPWPATATTSSTSSSKARRRWVCCGPAAPRAWTTPRPARSWAGCSSPPHRPRWRAARAPRTCGGTAW